MRKIDVIYRFILHAFFTEKRREFTQKDLAQRLRCSVSTVFHALAVPRAIGAIRVSGRDFTVTNAEKFLTYWATRRRLDREIFYRTYSPGRAIEREGMMPPKVIFAAYSAYRLLYHNTPADYDMVYVYASSLDVLKARFPSRSEPPNLVVFKWDHELASYGPVTPPVQLFVDLWNLPEWYAHDFHKALAQKLFS